MKGILFEGELLLTPEPAGGKKINVTGCRGSVKSMNSAYWPSSILSKTSKMLHLPGPFLDVLLNLRKDGKSLGAWAYDEEVSFTHTEGQCLMEWNSAASSAACQVLCSPVQAMILHCLGAAKAAGIDRHHRRRERLLLPGPGPHEHERGVRRGRSPGLQAL